MPLSNKLGLTQKDGAFPGLCLPFMNQGSFTIVSSPVLSEVFTKDALIPLAIYLYREVFSANGTLLIWDDGVLVN